MSATLQRLLFLTAFVALQGCANLRVPAMSSLDAHKLEIRYRWASTPTDTATVTLLDSQTNRALATAPSLFSFEAVRAEILPDRKRSPVFVSASGDTVLIHEIASESSPDEQLIVFSRLRGGDAPEWIERRYFPPSRPALPYALYARTSAVDDDHIYFAFSDGTIQEMNFDQLNPVPATYESHYHAMGEQNGCRQRLVWHLSCHRRFPLAVA